jgi:Glyoxalase/Bleomycin resistance protein/Dioxygenase superfamily
MAGRNGISRVVMIYRPENLRSAVREFKQALDITDFEGPYDLGEMGIQVVISWTAGIELIAPMQSGTHSAAMWDVLKQRGEGMFNLVYRVRDLQKAEAHAAAHGYPVVASTSMHSMWNNPGGIAFDCSRKPRLRTSPGRR